MVTAVDQIDDALLLVQIDDVLLRGGQFLFLLLDQLLAVPLQFVFVLLTNFARFAQVDYAFGWRHKAVAHDSVSGCSSAVSVTPSRASSVLLQVLPELPLDGTPQLLVDQLVDAGRVPIPRSEPLSAARTVEVVLFDGSAEAVPAEPMLAGQEDRFDQYGLANGTEDVVQLEVFQIEPGGDEPGTASGGGTSGCAGDGTR